MKKYSILLHFIALLILIPGKSQQSVRQSLFIPAKLNFITTQKTQTHFSESTEKYNVVISEIRWTGTISVIETYSGLTGISERKTEVSFNNVLPTLGRNIETTDFNFTDDKGTGYVTEHAEVIIVSKDEKTGTETKKVVEKCDCTGSGKSELHEIVIDHSEKTYRIHAMPFHLNAKEADRVMDLVVVHPGI
jgi:hypothetical protein